MKRSVILALALSFFLMLLACRTSSSNTPQDVSQGEAQENKVDISEQVPEEESMLPDTLIVENAGESTSTIASGSEAKYANVENKEKKSAWDEITTDGVNEELLLENIDTELLVQIATELQALVDEEMEEERENPEIVITEGWARVFETERYKKVLNIGSPAMKPLYLILYKSPNAGMYEYLCARILYELSGSDFYWTNSRDFMVGFNEKIIENRQ